MSDADDEPLDAALAAFAAAQDGPDPPTAEAFLARHPDLAVRLAPLLRSVSAVEALRSATAPDGPAGAGGERVGPYRLVREIGRGGMGTVYEAEDTEVPRRAAVKVVRPGALDPGARAALLREARIAAALQHPNVVPVFGAGEDAGVAYIAMQYIDGHPLSAVIRARRRDTGLDSGAGPTSDASLLAGGAAGTDPRQVAALGRQAAAALAFVHESGVLHRDVKPGNLLLDAHGHLWLTDFGLARTTRGTEDTLGGRVGTMRYASPEQVAGAPLDPRTDVYSLGATLYELLTLHPAFAGDDLELLARIQSEEPVPVRRLAPGVPADLATVVHKALARRPGDRYPSAAELGADLDRFLRGEPVLARPLSRRQRAGRWALKRRRPLALAGLVLVLGLSLAAFFAWRAYRAELTARQQLEQREAIMRELLSEVNKSEAVFRHLPNGQAEHRRLVRALKDVVCRWADEPGATAASKVEAVRACIRLGETELNAGERAEGRATLDEALRRVRALRDAAPADSELRFLHARVRQYQAGALATHPDSDFDASLAAAAEAAALLDALVDEFPNRTEYRNPRSHLAQTVAGILTRRREYGAAVEMWEKAVAADRWLAEKYPTGHPQSYIRLVFSWTGLAQARVSARKLDEAEAAFAEAVRNYEVLCEPQFAYPKLNRGATFFVLHDTAGLLLARGKDAEARPLIERCIADSEALVAEYPDRGEFKAQRWAAYAALGVLEYLTGNEEASRAAFRTARAYAPSGTLNQRANTADVFLGVPFADLRDPQRCALTLEEYARTYPAQDLRFFWLEHAVAVGDWARAHELLAALAVTPPEERHRPLVHLLRAKVLLADGRTAEAREALAEADRVHARELFIPRPDFRVLRREVELALRGSK